MSKSAAEILSDLQKVLDEAEQYGAINLAKCRLELVLDPNAKRSGFIRVLPLSDPQTRAEPE
jgi:hypothetical protein